MLERSTSNIITMGQKPRAAAGSKPVSHDLRAGSLYGVFAAANLGICPDLAWVFRDMEKRETNENDC